MINLLIMALCNSLLGNSYEFPSIITDVSYVNYFDTSEAQSFIMKMYLF